jgi:hypothetical protein
VAAIGAPARHLECAVMRRQAAASLLTPCNALALRAICRMTRLALP